MLEKIRHLWEHLLWADVRLFEALPPQESPAGAVHREFAHLIAAQEIWLARLQNRQPHTEVWPAPDRAALGQLMNRTHAAFSDYLCQLDDGDLQAEIRYSNSAGERFSNTVSDILLHIALHSQYHRGKINLLLRQGGYAPVGVDYVAFVRGVPAAIDPTAQRPPAG